MVDSCHESIPELWFDLYAIFKLRTELSYDFHPDEKVPIVMLCFGENNKESCHSFDGEAFTPLSNSSRPHFAGRLATYHGNAFVVGSLAPNNAVTEIFDGNHWEIMMDYPFSNYINSYGVVSLPDQVVIFGGRLGNSFLSSNQIVSYKDSQWHELGRLKFDRYAHSAWFSN